MSSSDESRPPIFNVPGALSATIGVLVLLHGVRALVLSSQAELELLLQLAFIPARYDPVRTAQFAIPGGTGAEIWTFASYALVHADVTHLLINSVWLLAFGTPLARRFGSARFLLFLLLTSVGGALAHLLTHFGELYPMIGASGAVSGCMAGAMRFIFQPRGGIALFGDRGLDQAPAVPLRQLVRDRRILVFVGVWAAFNVLFALVPFQLGGESQAIAWEAHVGGFVAGLLAFSVLDRKRPRH